jgi:hypothetical protein
LKSIVPSYTLVARRMPLVEQELLTFRSTWVNTYQSINICNNTIKCTVNVHLSLKCRYMLNLKQIRWRNVITKISIHYDCDEEIGYLYIWYINIEINCTVIYTCSTTDATSGTGTAYLPKHLSGFIQCNWGIPKKMACQNGNVWSQKFLTCTHGTC